MGHIGPYADLTFTLPTYAKEGHWKFQGRARDLQSQNFYKGKYEHAKQEFQRGGRGETKVVPLIFITTGIILGSMKDADWYYPKY